MSLRKQINQEEGCNDYDSSFVYFQTLSKLHLTVFLSDTTFGVQALQKISGFPTSPSFASFWCLFFSIKTDFVCSKVRTHMHYLVKIPCTVFSIISASPGANFYSRCRHTRCSGCSRLHPTEMYGCWSWITPFTNEGVVVRWSDWLVSMIIRSTDSSMDFACWHSDGQMAIPLSPSTFLSSVPQKRSIDTRKRTFAWTSGRWDINVVKRQSIRPPMRWSHSLVTRYKRAYQPITYSWIVGLSILLHELHQEGLFVIGMVKAMKQRYQWENQLLTLRELFQIASPTLAASRFCRLYGWNWSLVY